MTFSGVPFPTVSPSETQQHPRSNSFPVTSATFSGLTSPSQGHPITIDTYPLTFILFFLASSTTGQNLFKDQSMEQFRFFCENPSVAEANTAISFTPISSAVSIPLALGTKHGQETPQYFLIEVYSSLLLAICGTHFGETKDPTQTTFSPDSDKLLIKLILSSKLINFFSFCNPSLGPTSTTFTNSPLYFYNFLAYQIVIGSYLQCQLGQFLDSGDVHACYPIQNIYFQQYIQYLHKNPTQFQADRDQANGFLILNNNSTFDAIESQISIPKVKVSQLQKNTFIYEMDIATRWSKWHLEKKYADFVELHKFLSKEFDNLPEFPESLIGSILGQNEDDIEEYRDILEDYMRITSLRKDIINSAFYSQFLQLAKNSQALLANKPKFEGQFQIEEKINDDGKIIIDFYYGDGFIVFATGNNSPLEKFNATIANTKFPWEDDDEIQFVLPLGTIECWKLKKKPYGYTRIWARNYPKQVTKFLFLPDAESMIVGLADGSIQIFKLVPRGANTYYEHLKTINIHEDSISGLHLDKVNMILYSSSIDGYLNISDAKNGVLIDSLEMHSQITSIYGESQNCRLVVALGEGNMEVYEYDHRAKLKILTNLTTPDSWNIKVMFMDRVKSYFFVGAFDSGSIYIYELPKPGNQKLMKQVAALKNKQGITSMHFVHDKMELIVACQTGQIFFWDCIRGKQIYMLRPFQSTQIGKTHYLPMDRTLITAQRGRLVKFWSIPKQWRDTAAQQEEQRQIQIRRKVENLHKVRQAIKRKGQDSDDDDLACWYIEDSESEEEDNWFNFII